jgi:hypothetical protein
MQWMGHHDNDYYYYYDYDDVLWNGSEEHGNVSSGCEEGEGS